MNRYVILRDANTGIRAGQPFAFGMALESAVSAVPPEPSVEVAELSQSDVKDLTRSGDVLEIARAMPIKLAEPLRNQSAATSQSDNTWGVDMVGAPGSNFDGSGIPVAVLDTGIHRQHTAFAGMNIVEKDFSGDGDGDENGHGTHCAGTIFGRDVNGTRIGVAPGVPRAIIGKVLGNDGRGSSEMMFDGMKWAFDEGARVMSMSLGFDFPGLAVALQNNGVQENLAVSIALEAYRKNLRVFDRIMAMFRAQADMGLGCVVVGAAGNESMRGIDPTHEVSVALPAAAEGVVSVGAAGQASGGKLNIADFSNTGPMMCGPGVGVLSAQTGTKDQLIAFSGTSMATPHVAGLAALWWQALLQQPVPVSDKLVAAKLMASAQAGLFTQATDVLDRGVGLAMAP